MLHRTVIALAAAASVTLLASSAFAQDITTDQFEVSIHVQQTCLLQIDDLNFGIVDDLSASIAGTTTGSVVCQSQSPQAGQVSFDIGNGGGTFQQRQMEGDVLDEVVQFNIYADAGHTQVLGDGSDGTVTVPVDTETQVGAEFTVFGQTAPNQNVLAGTYTSVITATLTF